VIGGNPELGAASRQTKTRAADAGGRNFTYRISPSKACAKSSREIFGSCARARKRFDDAADVVRKRRRA
jgi:hypothetical protein